MRLFRCDRCGSESTTSSGWKVVGMNDLPAPPVPNQMQALAYPYVPTYGQPELCSGCVLELKEWLKPIAKAE